MAMLRDKAKHHKNPQKGAQAYVIKPRRIGSTALFTARHFAHAWAQDDLEAVIVAQTDLRAAETLHRCKQYYRSLPASLRMALAHDAKAGLRFADTRGSIIIIPSNNIETARGGTKQRELLTELCYYKRPVYVLEELAHFCIGRSTEVVAETTGKKRGGEAHEYWKECLKYAGTPAELMYPVFINWRDNPAYSIPFDNAAERDMYMSMAFEYEPRLRERAAFYKLTPGQTVWMFFKLRDVCKGDYEKFCQEYPLDQDEAWRTVGASFYGQELLNAIEVADWEEHAEFLTFENFPLIKKFETFDELAPKTWVDETKMAPYIKIWRRPQAGRPYIVGSDTGGGEAGNNPSVCYVADMFSLEMMATFHGVVRPDEQAYAMASLCQIYNGAEAAPEANGPGIALIQELKKIWPHIFQWRTLDNHKDRIGNKLGWWTGPASRPIMLETGKRLVEDWARGRCTTNGLIKDRMLLEEMKTFVDEDGSGHPEAAPGCLDDRVMAWNTTMQCAVLETAGGANDITSLYRAVGATGSGVYTAHLNVDDVIETLVNGGNNGQENEWRDGAGGGIIGERADWGF